VGKSTLEYLLFSVLFSDSCHLSEKEDSCLIGNNTLNLATKRAEWRKEDRKVEMHTAHQQIIQFIYDLQLKS
jgi:hypothetical protein